MGTEKTCTGCKQVKSLEDYSPDRRARDGLQTQCRACTRIRVRTWQVANPDRVRASAVRRAAEIRAVVFDHYGWSCTCCGSARNLCIDHVNGDGAEHRDWMKGTGRGIVIYRWLIKNDFPGGFQTLCTPCNVSKRSGNRCTLDHRKPDPVRDFNGGLWLPGSLAMAVRQRAAEEDMTISEWIRYVLKKELSFG